MAEKVQPIGICDLCLAAMPRDRWYTRRGPRLYCSTDCRNTANSRAGAPIRTVKLKARVKAGTWQNPHHLNPPSKEEQARRASKVRKQEVAKGIWRNPALSPEARAKLSRPRKHSGALHSAIEQLKQGARIQDLTPEEQAAHRQYRKQLRDRRKEELNRQARERYRRQQESMTEEEREHQRARWRAHNSQRRNKQTTEPS